MAHWPGVAAPGAAGGSPFARMGTARQERVAVPSVAGTPAVRPPARNEDKWIVHVLNRLAFADSDGWDTHVAQGAAEGQMAARLTEFAQAIAALHQDLGDKMQDVVVLTMSEFGRTARENGNRGTDHGHANVMFVAGGPVKGGKVYGRWPGLQPEQLYEGRDLALTTDFRDVFAEIVLRHLGLVDPAPVFPGFQASPGRFRSILA